jgi:hypothetical protein
LDHSNHFVVTSEILKNWRSSAPGWATNISSNVYFGNSTFVFPVPDSTIVDEDNNYSIAIEFKSTLENKRGALTALGQAIAYTQDYSMAYLVIPNKINGYDLEKFMCDLFTSREINKKLPVGLIVYDVNTNTPSLKFEIETAISSVTLTKFNGTYWATFRDSYPDSVWRILDIAYLTEEQATRKKIIWDKFYYDYLLPIPKEFWLDSDLDDWFGYPKTYLWDGSPQIIGEITVKEKIEEVDNGTITLPTAKSIIGKRYFFDDSGDVPYHQVQKNIFNFIINLNLLDDFFYLTDTGFELHRIGKLYGSTSQVFLNKLAKVVLIEGKHLDLIIEISNLQKKIIRDIKSGSLTVPPSSSENKFVRKEIGNDFYNNGKLKTNPSTSSKPFLSPELQLWNGLGLVEKVSTSYYTAGTGFNFNWDKITDILIPR